jgi:hypothetical protein
MDLEISAGASVVRPSEHDGTMTADLEAAIRRLGVRDPSRSEASIQSDIRLVLLLADLGLEAHDLAVDLEVPAAGGRIDILVGRTVIEVKRDLTRPGVAEAALVQLGGYLKTRLETAGGWHVGILTDGVRWEFVQLGETGEALTVGSLEAGSDGHDAHKLLGWLRAVVGLTPPVPPTPELIADRLGALSPSHRLDAARLRELYESCKNDPEVRLKRELWAKLLQTALGTHFTDTDELFLDHTLLVVLAELVAHAVVGFDVTTIEPAALISGREFQKARIGGVVEEDFFDWPLAAEGGDDWIRTLARRIASFDWSAGVEHDILKVLYESIITPKQRHSLGEYYTPDWLAERIVDDTVDDPLAQRVHDPSCGSGTFVFHAARRYLLAAEAAGHDTATAIAGLVHKVSGVDVHPVAVTLARVTYLLAIGQERIRSTGRPAFSVPVYLGDSLAWQHNATLFSGSDLVIQTADGLELFAGELRFPGSLLADADVFDRVVADLADRATSPTRKYGFVPGVKTLLKPLGLPADDQKTIEQTFARLCELHDHHRNHIWSYYARNLARPLWLAFDANRVDRLVGNPPWLTYNAMPPSMQEAFRTRSEERGLWPKARNHDLAAFFVARSVEQYLKPGGRFGFVMPHATLSRKHAQGFRTGNWSGTTVHLHAAFDTPWDLDAVKPAFFPVPSCVVRGTRAAAPTAMPAETVTFAGTLPEINARWEVAASYLRVSDGAISAAKGELSPYAKRFQAGAKANPRMLIVVEDADAGPLGTPAGLRRVRSRRGRLDKDPWRSLPAIEETVEERFIHPLILGESIVPFRQVGALNVIVPWDGERMLDSADGTITDYPGLSDWWAKAEALWLRHRSSEKFSLLQRIDFQRRLSSQFPQAAHRVVYTASGSIMAACRIADPTAVIDQMLYWAPVADEKEALYLCGIFNSSTLTDAVAPFQARGQFGTRHFDKYIFQLPIPTFDPADDLHATIAELAAKAETLAADVDLLPSMDFKRQRRKVRDALSDADVLPALDSAVKRLLGGRAEPKGEQVR